MTPSEKKLLLLRGCAMLALIASAGCTEAKAEGPVYPPGFGPLLVAVDSAHHVVCYARHPWSSERFQCFPLDTTNSRVIVR